MGGSIAWIQMDLSTRLQRKRRRRRTADGKGKFEEKKSPPFHEPRPKE
jgi:hypothetical protein